MADAAFHIHYRLDGHGWATCDVSIGEKKVTVTASYLSDALGQLAAGTLMLRLGAPSVRISFDEEPGEFRWGFDWHRLPDGSVNHLRVRIWMFNDWQTFLPDDRGEVLLDEIVAQEVLYLEVLRTLDDVLVTYGEAGYKDQWDLYAFPKAIHDELRRLFKEWPGL